MVYDLWFNPLNHKPYTINCPSSLPPVRRPFPLLIEEACVYDPTGPAGVGRSVDIHNGPIGKLGVLPGIIEVVVLSECESAIDDHILLWIEGIGIDHYRDVV